SFAGATSPAASAAPAVAISPADRRARGHVPPPSGPFGEQGLRPAPGLLSRCMAVTVSPSATAE
ncbi:hypothetical protein, partial [Streptomyces hilarionis]|uniref:hypothetical protein n=1 Tax=Streptomyces hilarionis TaxID=2839954 RepID=UPI00211A3091